MRAGERLIYWSAEAPMLCRNFSPGKKEDPVDIFFFLMRRGKHYRDVMSLPA
jgi:hypothetical protein